MPDSHSFRQLMGCFATGITVVTADDPKLGSVGITINSVTSVSLIPQLVLFCLEREAQLFSAFKKSHYFAINILGEDQETVSRYFADRHHNKKPAALWDKPHKNGPILRGTLGWMMCKKVATYKGGDHSVIMGEVVDLHRRTGHRDPLLYFHGRYRRIKD